MREGHLCQIHQSAADDRFCAHVSANRRSLRGSDSPRRLSGTSATRLPGGVCWTDNAGRVVKQFADGISYSRHPETVSEVWNLLAAVKSEFAKFGEALSKVKDKLDQASSDMDKVAVRSRAITKKLRDVEELPSNPQPLLPELLRDEEET